ncbi:hypothetical protein CJO79_06725 [Ralstonia solanacearum]|nr:hypothetical protein CJO76_06735 [Ralstonia solanacearum]AXV90711.1 hypothetical protein CJO79_06725 [Ralstonia solanacearum]AXW18876.1 hypothetical protein CJO85_06765 [Ralstonia solanacearum]AXW61790.1 hypothetical protein CJO94_07305 [Ralstonia solanacearum]
MSEDGTAFICLGVGGLLALVAGFITMKGNRPMQAALLIVAGLILLGLPVLVFFAIASAYRSMAL